MDIFAQESRLTRFLNRIGDLILLNILTLVCCIPIITVGASVSAMYQVTMKMVKGEEGKICRAFIQGFKENLKQSTLIWLIGGGIGAVLYCDIRILGKIEIDFANVYKIVLFLFLLIILMLTFFALVVQARFENTLRKTWKNGILFCIIHFIKSIIMFIVILSPIFLLMVCNRMVPVVILIGISGPAYITSIYFRNLFLEFEPEKM